MPRNTGYGNIAAPAHRTKSRPRSVVRAHQQAAEWLLELDRHTGNNRPQFWLNGRRVAAHRFNFLTFRGEIPPNRVINPSCGNPRWVAPTHLQLSPVERPECRNGHNLKGLKNRYFAGRYLKCRECDRVRDRKAGARMKPALQRWFALVDIPSGDPNACWTWIGAGNGLGMVDSG